MLAKYSVKKPFTVFVCVILIIILGVVSFMNMTPDLLPDMDFPYVIIITPYVGASPEEVETVITKPLEQAMATLDNIKSIDSVSSENSSAVMLEFSDNVNMDSIGIDIRESIDTISGYWGDEIGTPYILKINPNMLPTTVAAVNVEGMGTAELSEFTDNTLMDSLEGTEGVARITASGMLTSEVGVFISTDKINATNGRINDAINAQLDSARYQLQNGKNQLYAANDQLNGQKNEIASQRSQLETNLNSLISMSDTLANLDAQKTQLESTLPPAALATDPAYQQVLATITIAEDALTQAGLTRADLPGAITKLRDGIAQLDSASSQIDAGISQIGTQINSVDSAMSQLSSTGSFDMTQMISKDMISALLTAQNFSMPAGYVTEEGVDYLVKVGDKFGSLDDMLNLLLLDPGIDGVEPVYLRDVADVVMTDDSSQIYAKINGSDGVLLSFTKQSNYSTATVADNISDKFSQLESSYEGLSFTTLMDQGDYIHIVVNSVLNNLLVGAVLAILILYIFLKDIRPTFLVACSIPISVTFAIVLMYFSGVTLNVISLAGLAVGVGMLVDNSIVVIENIYRLRNSGVSAAKAAASGAIQVAGAITSSTLTTVCVFFPIVFVDGITKQLFTDMALTIAFSLLASLIVALTLVPAMASGMLKNANAKPQPRYEKFLTEYEKLLKKAMGKRALVLLMSVFLLISSAALTFSKGFSFMPEMAGTELMVNLEMPEGTLLADTAYVSDTAAERIMQIEGVEAVGCMLSDGMGSIMGLTGSSENTTSVTIYAVLAKVNKKTNSRITKEITEACADLPCEVTVNGGYSSMSSMEALTGSGVSVNIYGNDLDKLQQASSEIAELLKTVEGTQEVTDGLESATPEIRISVDKQKAMNVGLTVAQVYAALAEKMNTQSTATTLTLSSNSYNVNVIAQDDKKITPEDIMNFVVNYTDSSGNAKSVSLSDIATIERTQTLGSISRTQQKRYITASASVEDGYNVTLVTNNAKAALKDYTPPEGITYEFKGENESITDALGDLLLMLLLGIVIVYLIMVAQFQSLLSPFIVLFTVPLAFTGGLMALLICGMDISVISMIGFVMLVGIIVNNGIVLVDYINRLRKSGVGKEEAIVRAAATRLRPVLMTALTTILGLLPLALGIGSGAEMMQPVAVVCIGGLLYATVMTLFIVPIMYDVLNKKELRNVTDEELNTDDLMNEVI